MNDRKEGKKMKIGFLFPGQGSQSVGMGKDLYEKYESVRQIYDKVKEITNIDVAKISFEGQEEQLNQTKNTQLCILTMSLAILDLLEKNEIKAQVCAGLSLGEYTALLHSKVLELEEGVNLVKKRGEYMQTLLPEGEWLMAAIIGLSQEQVQEVCSEVKSGFVAPANFNSKEQIVISGEKIAIQEAETIAKQLGAKKVAVLKTAGPFHTPMLKQASEKFREELEKVHFHDFQTKVIKNIDGTVYQKGENMVEILENHIICPVEFSKSLETMLDMGVDTFIEVGPGKTLSGFVKRMKTQRPVQILNISNVETLENAINLLQK